MGLDPIQNQICYLSFSTFKWHISILAVMFLLYKINYK